MKKSNKSYQYPKEDKEILAKMRHPNYEGVNLALPPNATALERTKYQICKKALSYKLDNGLTTEQMAEKINLSTPETKEILLCHIHKFTLDRLTAYLTNLFPDAELGIVQTGERKRVN